MAVVVAAHDISGVGRCSLTTALAVLPALGHVCYPLPTAVLSQQTAFPSYSFLDLTGHMPAYLAGWKSLGIMPDMIYTGFLGNGKQTELLKNFIEEHPDAKVVVDPVMGDGGAIYPCYGEDFVAAMRGLAAAAHILLPNATEFNLLTGRAAERELPDSEDTLLQMTRGLSASRLEYVVITGVRPGQNLLIDISGEKVTALSYRDNGVFYSGTGDLFASALCGLLLSKVPIADAVNIAAGFVSEAAHSTPACADTRMGAVFEPLLKNLIETRDSYNEKR